MTPREVVLEQIAHHETATVPYTVSFEDEVGQRLDAHYGGAHWRDRLETFIDGAGVVQTRKQLGSEESGFYTDLYGTLWRTDKRPFHLERPGLTEANFDGYDWPAPEAFFADADGIAAATERCRKNNGHCFMNAGLGWGLFETSWGIRGFENVLMDVVTAPDFYEEMLDRITAQFLAYVDFTCRHLPDVDAIMFGDDWGDQRGVMIGPERWRKMFKPRCAKIYAAAHAHGKLVISHCCGSVAEIMPDIIEIGLDVLESVQPEAAGMNPYELKRKWGDKITFWGCLGSQSTVSTGTPDDIHSAVRRLRREMSRGGGYILAPAKTLQPGTPTANAVAVVEAFAALN